MARKAALLSVSDKTGLVEFARALSELGYVLLSTSGTAAHLKQNGLTCEMIEDYTGQPEILDGRVKTLHPKIHAGILARRDDPSHLAQLEQSGIYRIDIVVVNLYPFQQKLRESARFDRAAMIEYIDVGGATLMRAAAKNMEGVLIISSTADYGRVVEQLRSGQPDQLAKLRSELAAAAFAALAQDNLEIARYFSSAASSEGEMPLFEGLVLAKSSELRYGENPHQPAALYSSLGAAASYWQQLGGKELSYNNMLDFDAAWRILAVFRNEQPFCVIIKHLNPCGAAIAASSAEALRKAKLSDPRSHFGGILGFNRIVDEEIANLIREDFAELVVAPDFTAEALALLCRNKNLRLVKADLEKGSPHVEVRSVAGRVALQHADVKVSRIADAKLATSRAATQSELVDLQFAWELCAHVKSNAIVLVKNGMLVGVGAGQMSRIDSVDLAISKARLHGHALTGAVAASDAFFPFTDSVAALHLAGVGAIIAPAGARRDEEVAASAESMGMTLLFAADRHFRH